MGRILQTAYNPTAGEWIKGGVVQTIIAELDFEDNAAAVKIADLPKGARILAVEYRVTEAFNASGTNTLSIGTTQLTPTEFVNAADITGLGNSDREYLAQDELAADGVVYAIVGATGDAATTGKVQICIEWC